ncbi:family 1 glycosylhydrolase [Nocardia transvalensis]|uniref:family 1 glycosylhydrolase n=1 Tax=Nocardia transvalensis TaxID=37333 RepID=UPI0018950405|nr:family 1 glycosylhydrolase [Nocardia transvalensis]MBF6328020.1 glycoside hydrolase family 1 protein [Nocardia transvalensis]
MRQSTRPRLLAACAAVALVLVTGPTAAAFPLQPVAGVPSFDDGFLWGVSSSGFQSEGRAPDSNWTRYIASGAVEPYHDSVRFLDHYTADIDRAARLGAKVFRISLEWARLQPKPDGWDGPTFAVYDAVVNAIKAAGMTPMLTLDHWVYPGWAAERGGWRNPGMVEDWLVNARKVVEHFASRDPIWVTINEPAAYLGAEMRIGALSPSEWPAAMDRLAQAHNAIYDTIHEVQPGAQVTSNIGFVPGPGAEVAANQPYVDKVRDKLDFVGVDYYFGPDPTTLLPGSSAAGAPGMWNLPLQTEGIYYALRHYARQFPGKPLYVVENGMPTEDGKPRPDGYTRADHLRDTIYWLQRAKADGMNVIGYNYWSITDNYEWGSYTPRFGLYTVDVARGDQELVRRPTDAVEVYASLARSGGVPANYRPTRPPVLCSQVDPPDSCTQPVGLPFSFP